MQNGLFKMGFKWHMKSFGGQCVPDFSCCIKDINEVQRITEIQQTDDRCHLDIMQDNPELEAWDDEEIEKAFEESLIVFQEQPEKHMRGYLSIESLQASSADCDFGLQIAEDGRVWICIDGRAFIRFKPSRLITR
jgi:hypothetical protein